MAFITTTNAQTSKDDRMKTDLRLTMPKARVTQVIDGQTFVVNNATTITMPMMYIPWENPQTPGENMRKAKDFLEKELKDRFVRIYQVRDQKRGQLNSMGHTQGFVMRDDGVWIQEAMVLKGLAFAYPTQDHFEFAADLYKVEAEARESKQGLWADPKWDVVSDKEANTLKDRFAIVEGRVFKVATRSNTIFLNFDRDHRTDFTVAIESFRRRDFSRAGANPMHWSGKTIRVRGWLRDYNGPFMEIYHPAQVEVVEQTENDAVETDEPVVETIEIDTIGGYIRTPQKQEPAAENNLE